MQLSAGMPGKHRKDRALSNQVKSDKHLGANSGNWVKNRFPEWALQPLEKLVTEARAYHAAVTLPFSNGVGILPAALIVEYGERMRDFTRRFHAQAVDHFQKRYPEMIEWAKSEHNGTFDATDYPEVAELMKSFYMKTEPIPVPDAGHFESTMKSLLGVDADSVNIRVQDAMQEAQRELMKRMIEPVKAMAAKLAEQPKMRKLKDGSTEPYESPVFRDTLIQNVKDIAGLAPKLNIAGDPAIDGFVAEMQKLTVYEPDALRKSANERETAAAKAKAVLAKLEQYKI